MKNTNQQYFETKKKRKDNKKKISLKTRILYILIGIPAIFLFKFLFSMLTDKGEENKLNYMLYDYKTHVEFLDFNLLDDVSKNKIGSPKFFFKNDTITHYKNYTYFSFLDTVSVCDSSYHVLLKVKDKKVYIEKIEKYKFHKNKRNNCNELRVDRLTFKIDTREYPDGLKNYHFYKKRE